MGRGNMGILNVRIPDALVNRLNKLAERTDRTKSYYVRHALENQLQDIEDYVDALTEFEAINANRSRTYTIEEVRKELGLGN